MNVYRCAGFSCHGQYCAFLDVKLDANGRVDETSARCRLRGLPRDDYRLWPEHDVRTGRVIHNNTAWTEPIRIGPDVIWETITTADNGLSYSPSNKPRRTEDYNAHPGYVIREENMPSQDFISEETIITPFGDGINLSFSTLGWISQRIWGMQNVERCMYGLYGSYKPEYGMIIPKCAQNYCGSIPDWINYTYVPFRESSTKEFKLANATDEELVDHCVKWFGRTKSAVKIIEIMKAIRKGEFIWLDNVLENHGYPEKYRQAFMKATNIKTKSLFLKDGTHKSVNLKKYWLYYKVLKRDLPYEKGLVLRANIINYVLNDPYMATIDPDRPDVVNKDGSIFNKPSRRYWWIVNIISDAVAEGNEAGKKPIVNTSILPQWFRKMVNAMVRNAKNVVEYEPERKVPVIRLLDIISDMKEYSYRDTPHWRRRLKFFSSILRAGVKWTKSEVRNAWWNFCRASDAGDPVIFWEWVESVRNASSADIHRFTIDQTPMSDKREFATNLLEARIQRDSFQVYEPPLQSRWKQITPKVRRTSEEGQVKTIPEEMFWNELTRVHVVTGKRAAELYESFKHHFAQVDPENVRSLMEDLKEEARYSVVMGNAIDGDDIGYGSPYKIVDYDGSQEIFNKYGDDVEPDDRDSEEIIPIDSQCDGMELTEEIQDESNSEISNASETDKEDEVEESSNEEVV